MKTYFKCPDKAVAIQVGNSANSIYYTFEKGDVKALPKEAIKAAKIKGLIEVKEDEIVEEPKTIPVVSAEVLNDLVPEVNLDLNNDGKIDKKDASIAGKVLANHKKGKKR